MNSSVRFLCLLAAMALLAGSAAAEISVGAWTFDDLAFADDATQLDDGIIYPYCGATDLDDALTGYSPDRQIVNTGMNDTYANHFQLDFIDLVAANGEGGDLVFFECRWSADAYEIAVRPAGGDFTGFLPYLQPDFVDTGELGCASIWGVEIELDDYGLAENVVVDAIQFRAIADEGAMVEGDPLMAAVLNASYIATESSSWSTVKASYR